MENDNQLLARLDERQKAMDEKIDRILSHTEKTNGRVSKLELWQSYLKGAIVIIAALMGWAFKAMA